MALWTVLVEVFLEDDKPDSSEGIKIHAQINIAVMLAAIVLLSVQRKRCTENN